MTMVFDDVRYALRQMMRAPGFTLAAITTLALAIGANTAIFSVVHGVLMRPLPYPAADRLIRPAESHPGGTPLLRDAVLSNFTFEAWSAAPRAIERLAAYGSRTYTVSIRGAALRIDGATASPGLFEMLGAAPAAGRFFTPDEAREASNLVLVLSHAAWRNRFAGDASIVGSSLTVDGRPHVVVGIAPAWFYFPDRAAEIWTPAVVQPSAKGTITIVRTIARLRPGATLAQAETEATAAARSMTRPPNATLMFGEGGPVEVRATGLNDHATAGVRPALVVMTAGVSLVLLIACANVASLLLARGVARRRELSVRAALGAARGRLLAQLLTESVLLSLVGGAIGVLLAWTIAQALPAIAPADFPRLDDVQLDLDVLAFAVLVSTLSGILAGVAPAFRGASSLSPTMRLDDERSVGGRDVARAALLGAEAALGVMLLVAASLLLRSFAALTSVDAGYDAGHLLAARVYRPGAERAAPERSTQFVDALVARLRAAPGVVAAGAGNMVPLGESSYISGFQIPLGPGGAPVSARAHTYTVTPGYAEALGLRLREGRFFDAADVTSGIQLLIVNRSFVTSYIKDGRPVAGRTFGKERRTEIIGVVDDVLRDGLDAAPHPAMYLLHNAQNGIRREVNVLIRTAGDPAAAVPALRSIVAELDANAALGHVGPMTDQIARSVAQPRFAALVIAGFAGVALVLASAGLYGVMSYTVSQRRREIGVRSALGATRRDVIALVLRQGLAVTGTGVILGIAASALAAPLLRRVLFGIEPLDGPSFVIGPAILLLVAAASCLVPASRAAGVNPAEALRAE